MRWTDDELSAALAELREEPLPEGALAQVRETVMARVERTRRRWLWWLAPVPMAAALVLLMLPRPAEIDPPPLVAQAPAPAPLMHSRPVQIRRSKPPRFVPTAQEGLVRLASTRNDIIIYWDLTDEGETQ